MAAQAIVCLASIPEDEINGQSPQSKAHGIQESTIEVS